jgi:glycosyltransferase involved in cell wall biosynthesis
MRLLFLNHNYRYSGTYYRAMPMAEELARRGHEVTLCTVSPHRHWTSEGSSVNGVTFLETPNLGQDNSGNGYGPLDNIWRLMHALAHHYDIIHMFDHKPNATFGGFAGKLRGARLVADWADWWGGPGGVNDVPQRRILAVGKFEEWWERQSKKWADGVVTISRVLREKAIAIGCPEERVLYLPTGAPTDRIRPLPIAEARTRQGLPLNRRIVGFIGSGQGDLEIALRAIGRMPDTWFMVVGHKNPQVLELAHAHGMADRLWQTGFIPDQEVGLYLACANVMCLPLSDRAANRGRLPNKILDYMAAGRPVVASPVGDVEEIVKGLGVGLLAGNDEFPRVLMRILDDSGLQKELGERAAGAAHTEFDWHHLIDKLEEFYLYINKYGKEKKS